MNVIGSRPDGWWRDRDGAARALAIRLQRHAVARAQDVVLVLDGRPVRGLSSDQHSPLRVIYGEGRSADDRIVELVAGHPAPRTVEVVTADRQLRGRVARYGVAVGSPSALLHALDEASTE